MRIKRKRAERRNRESPKSDQFAHVKDEDDPKRMSKTSAQDEVSIDGPNSPGKRPTFKPLPKGHVVSSLFRNNPQIPKIQSSKVDKIQENIFTKSAFSTLDIHPHLISCLETNFNIATLTAVQEKSIPEILSGKDVLVQSQTGAGKTLAFAVPIIQMLQAHTPKIQRTDGAYAIILVPTRELAIQIYETFVKLTKPFTWIVPGCVMGGEKKKSEKARIRKGINILVATPGRLVDHLQNTASLSENLNNLKYFVIDEADRLLDMGFERDASYIIETLNKKKREDIQTVLLSATLSQGVERLAGMTLRDPVHIEMSQKSTSLPSSTVIDTSTFATPDQLKHYFIVVPSKLRLVTLAAFILWKCKYDSKGSKMIVFLATQDSVEFHHQLLQETLLGGPEDEEKDVEMFKLHGDMAQQERTKVFKEFSSVTSGVLLCTDVASRGLDLPKVTWIVQYNTPGTPTDYIHRVGRTARAGHHGQALLFLTPSEVEYVKVLNSHKISLQELSMEDVLSTLLIHMQSQRKGSRDKVPHTSQESATHLQSIFEICIYDDQKMLQKSKKAYQSFIRAYSTYPADLKHIFHIKSMHIGHVAKSFGLREAPSKIAKFHQSNLALKQERKAEKRKQIEDRTDQDTKGRKVDLSEYGSGFDSKKSKQGKRKNKNKKKHGKKR